MKLSRRVLFSVWLLSGVLLAFGLWTPILFGGMKAMILLSILVLVLLPSLLFPRLKSPRVAAGLTFGLALLIAFWPRQNVDSGELRAQNWRALLAYRGTPYVWGGENARGIDCSGLIRRAFIEANLQTGLRTLNPSLWREAFTIWWNDCSAREMKAGYGGKIVPLLAADSLNELDTRGLQNGDLAVMQSGVHVLAYAGKNSWIQADPNLSNGGDKVIVTSAPSKNGWFAMRVQILRWRALDETTLSAPSRQSESPTLR